MGDLGDWVIERCWERAFFQIFFFFYFGIMRNAVVVVSDKNFFNVKSYEIFTR